MKGEEMRSNFDERVLGGGGVWYGSDLIVLIFLYVEGIDPNEMTDLHIRVCSGGRAVTDVPLMCHEELSQSFREDGQEVFFALCPGILGKLKGNKFDASFQVMSANALSRVIPIGVDVSFS